MKFEEYQKLQPLALEILHSIVKRKLTYIEEINIVGDIIKLIYEKNK